MPKIGPIIFRPNIKLIINSIKAYVKINVPQIGLAPNIISGKPNSTILCLLIVMPFHNILLVFFHLSRKLNLNKISFQIQA